MQMALDAKYSGSVADHGLLGSRGFVYGPAPIWIYTALLHVSEDPVRVVQIRAALVTVLTALAIVWLAALCRGLATPLGAIALLSPYLFIYARQLWDNTFLIPISALTVAAFISFATRPATWKMHLLALLMTAMMLTHLMSAALILPVTALAFMRHRRWFADHLKHFSAAVLLAIFLSARYILFLMRTPMTEAPRGHFSAWEGWIFPLTGGRIFSAFGMDYFFGETWFISPRLSVSSHLVLTLSFLTFVALTLVWVGMGLAISRVIEMRRTRTWGSPQDSLCVLCLSVFATQCVLNGLMRTYGQPHYFNSTWFCYFGFLWMALSAETDGFRRSLQRSAQVLYAVSSAAVLVYFVIHIHVSGGNQNVHYGPSLQTQIDVIRTIKTCPPRTSAYIAVENFRRFPHSLDILRTFVPEAPCAADIAADTRPLLIRPRGPDPSEGWLVAEEIYLP